MNSAVVWADVPLWVGVGALVVFVGLLIFRNPVLQIALTVVGVSPILWAGIHPDRPDEGGLWIGLLLWAATPAAFIATNRRWRVAVATFTLGAGLLLAVKQFIAASVLPAAFSVAPGLVLMGWLGAAVVLSVPTRRWALLGLGTAGGLATLLGVIIEREIREMPVLEAAHLAHRYRADRLWDELEEKAILEGDLFTQLEVLRLAPTRTRLGQHVASEFDASLPVLVGWEPSGLLEPSVAIALAWEEVRRGRRGRAIQLLRRHQMEGELAFHLSLLAMEAGDVGLATRAFSSASIPEGVPIAPGVLWNEKALYRDGSIEIQAAVMEKSREIVVRATGHSYQGPPELSLAWGHANVVSRDVEGEVVWTIPAELSSGAYRFVLSFDNDRLGPDGDRNLTDLSVEIR